MKLYRYIVASGFYTKIRKGVENMMQPIGKHWSMTKDVIHITKGVCTLACHL